MAVLSEMEMAMPRPNVRLSTFIVLSAGLIASQAGTSQSPKTAPQHSPTAAVEADRATLVLELDRAILVLKRGLKEHWPTSDQYLTAFEETSGTDSTGRPLTNVKEHVKCAIEANLPTYEIWDERGHEGPSIEIAAQHTIVEFTKRRNEGEQAKTAQQIEFRLPPCVPQAPEKGSAPQRVAVSAGVAMSTLKTKINPVYPAEALKNHVSGTVVLDAIISIKGGVKSLRAIGGPVSLQQAALDAVRQWIYRPYLLNNKPVEVETTINVVFPASR
jgi:TonB family protein